MKMSSMLRCVVLTTLVLCALDAVAGDSIIIKKKGAFNGTFLEFKAGRFYFTPSAGKAIHESASEVESLTIDPPSHAMVKERGKQKSEGYTLKGYEKGKFVVVRDGVEQQILAMNVTALQLAFDASRTETSEPYVIISRGEEVVIAEKVTGGVATVVQFHMANAVASMRQGSYVASKTRDAKGKLAMIRIDMPSWDSPVAKQYDIKSVPQFWFYDSKTQLVTKLTERFTDGDIDKAIQQVQ